MVQWLRLCAPTGGSPGSLPGQRTRSHVLQPRPGAAKTNKQTQMFLNLQKHPSSTVAWCHIWLSQCSVLPHYLLGLGLFQPESISLTREGVLGGSSRGQLLSAYVHAKLLQCPTLCNPMDCSLPGSSVHGILQARILEYISISFSRGSSGPKDQTRVSCIGRGFFTIEPPGKPPRNSQGLQQSPEPQNGVRHRGSGQCVQ